MKNIIFISKDALRKGVLPIYGNNYYKTPNIDALSAKETVFHRHYTAGASTAMAFTSMAVQKYCFETGRKLYNGNEVAETDNTIFDILYDKGYDVHIAWDDSYTKFARNHFGCEGKHTTVHSLKSIIPHHTPHVYGEFDDLTYKDNETRIGIKIVGKLFSDLNNRNHRFFYSFIYRMCSATEMRTIPILMFSMSLLVWRVRLSVGQI